MQTGTWYFAALTYDSVTGVAKQYLGTPGNIAEVGSDSVTAGSTLIYSMQPSNWIDIGSFRDTLWPLDGLIDEVRFPPTDAQYDHVCCCGLR